MAPTMTARPIGGPMYGMNQHPTKQPILVRTFAVALFVRAKGWPLLGARLADDGLAGEVAFLFPPEAKSAVIEYGLTKEELTGIMAETRRQR